MKTIDEKTTELRSLIITLNGVLTNIEQIKSDIEYSLDVCKGINITLQTNINDIKFSNRVINCLNRDGRFLTVQQLLDAYCSTISKKGDYCESPLLLTVRNLGRKGIAEIEQFLTDNNFI